VNIVKSELALFFTRDT